MNWRKCTTVLNLAISAQFITDLLLNFFWKINLRIVKKFITTEISFETQTCQRFLRIPPLGLLIFLKFSKFIFFKIRYREDFHQIKINKKFSFAYQKVIFGSLIINVRKKQGKIIGIEKENYEKDCFTEE